MFGQKKVAGSVVGGRADMQEMLEFAALHHIRPKARGAALPGAATPSPPLAPHAHNAPPPLLNRRSSPHPAPAHTPPPRAQVELMPLSRVNEAMARVQRGEARYRIVLTTDEVPPVAA